jgi:hypothetical protein
MDIARTVTNDVFVPLNWGCCADPTPAKHASLQHNGPSASGTAKIGRFKL